VSKRQYIEIGKIYGSFSFPLPFGDQTFDWSWEFTLLKLSIHELRRVLEGHRD